MAGLPAEMAFADLAAKVKAAGRARVRPGVDRARGAAPTHAAGDFRPDSRIVAIGSSTGGVEALLTVLAAFPANCPPTLITQHMPGSFTKSFAARLNRTCAAEVGEAYEGAPVEPGRIWLAPGGECHLEVAVTARPRCRLTAGPPVNGHRPSVDVLFESVAKCAGNAAVGVILTGMGRDGAQGLLQMRQAGARTIGQNEASSLIYGMPRVAFEVGAVEKQVHLTRISQEILEPSRVRNEGSLMCHS
jgi:two-component system chemotaxis response regulator CheB